METDEDAFRRESLELGQRSGKGVQPLTRTMRWLKRMANDQD